MLDFELAEIYGYTTKVFDQQVKRNEEKFPEDFRFQMTQEELKILRSQIVTSSSRKSKSWGGTRYLPWCFTESGIYMLMTVLKGELATKQSIALIRTFRAMKDYIVDNNALITRHDYLRLSMQLSDTQQTVHEIQAQIVGHEEKFSDVFEQLNDTVKKSEISPFMLDFSQAQTEFLFLEGQAMSAAEAYREIYTRAKKSIHIIDDYIDPKTLHLLQAVNANIDVTIFSDNNYNKLKLSDYRDFQTESPNISITFITSQRKSHDRFVILDYGTSDERVFLCGSSSKDAGKRMTAITEIENDMLKTALRNEIGQMLSNPVLVLK